MKKQKLEFPDFENDGCYPLFYELRTRDEILTCKSGHYERKENKDFKRVLQLEYEN